MAIEYYGQYEDSETEVDPHYLLPGKAQVISVNSLELEEEVLAVGCSEKDVARIHFLPPEVMGLINSGHTVEIREEEDIGPVAEGAVLVNPLRTIRLRDIGGVYVHPVWTKQHGEASMVFEERNYEDIDWVKYANLN